MKVPIAFTDHLRAKRHSAKHCIIATAAKRQWGGDWTVTHKSAEHVSASGPTMTWRLSGGAFLVALLFDLGIRLPVRSVRLVNGRAAKPKAGKARKTSSPRKRRARKARRAVAVVTGAGVVWLAVSGLAWVMFAIVGAIIGVLAVVAVVRFRADRRTAVPPARPVQTRPAGNQPSPILPSRPEPQPEPVQPVAPKAAPATIEAPAQAQPAEGAVMVGLRGSGG
jgi:hypothetical protein